MTKFIEREVYLGSQIALIDLILANTKSKTKTTYYALNSDCMLHYWKDESYRQIINKHKNTIYVDGMGVIFAQRILRLPIAVERISTTDLFPALMEEINKRPEQIKVFLLGSKGNTAERVLKSFSEKYPHVQFVGCHHGYFEKETESKRVIEEINQTQADILFVGFGNPSQEKWVDLHEKTMTISTIITCGGLFDYYSNNVKRAPLFMQKTGFEWLYRFAQEPRRLFGRYAIGNFNYAMKIVSLRFIKY